MLVREFKEKEGYRFPSEFLDLLPEKCIDETCNGDTIISDVLTSLRCSNPRCPTKLTIRLVSMLKRIGVKGIGTDKADDIITKFGIDNPMLIFAYNFDEDGCLTDKTNERISRDIQAQLDLRRSYTLSEYVKISNIPNIQDSADYLFGKYDDLNEAYEAIEKGGIEYVSDCLGIRKKDKDLNDIINRKTEDFVSMLIELRDELEYLRNYIQDSDIEAFKGYSNYTDLFTIIDSGDYSIIREKIRKEVYAKNTQFLSIRALKVYESLMLFKQDLFNALPFINIIKVNSIDTSVKFLKVLCSTEVGGEFKSKQEFYTFINNRYKDRVHVDFLTSAKQDMDVLIWAGGSNPPPDSTVRVTGKVKTVRAWNKRYEEHKNLGILKETEKYIPIMKAEEFIAYLENLQ